MPSFAVLIDDGTMIASDPGTEYPNMLMAMADALRTAAIIAAEQLPEVTGEQRIVCEIQNCETRERREMVVRFDVDAHCRSPIGG